MAERASQTTTLVFGGVSVDVALMKVSRKPAEAKHDTRRMIGDLTADEYRARMRAYFGGGEQMEADALADALLTPAAAARVKAAADPFGDGTAAPMNTGAAVARGPEPASPSERVEQGVYLDDGSFVDLTDRLAEIDRRTRIEGMEVLATIASSTVPRSRVRDSYYVGLAAAKANPAHARVLALLWYGLRSAGAAAVVRWTKKTNQALGIITATGSLDHGTAALTLLECEWAQNIVPPGPRATAAIRLVGELDERECESVQALVNALHQAPAALEYLRDERSAARSELLLAARAGEVDAAVLPPEPVAAGPVGEDLAAQFSEYLARIEA